MKEVMELDDVDSLGKDQGEESMGIPMKTQCAKPFVEQMGKDNAKTGWNLRMVYVASSWLWQRTS